MRSDRRPLRAALALLFALLAPGARAGELVVEAAPCAKSIKVRADHVPLGDVVADIATRLGIRVQARTPLPEVVSFNGSGPPEVVLKKLMAGRNLVLGSGNVVSCGGREVLTTMWLLPAGESVQRPAQPVEAIAAIQQPGEAILAPARPERPRGMRKRMNEEQWQKAKEEWKAGRLEVDPLTGEPVAVPQRPYAQ